MKTRRRWNWKQTPSLCQFGTYWCQDLWGGGGGWAQSSRPESWNCNLQVLIVLFHFDEEKNSFIEIKTEGEGSHPRWSRGTLNLGSVSHTRMHRPELVYSMHQISSCWINMSSSLPWYSEVFFFFLLVNYKFYLKINPVPNSLLHSASAVLGSLSFLEDSDGCISESTVSLRGTHTILKSLLFQKDYFYP